MTKRATWFFGYTPGSVEAVVRKGFPQERTTILWNSVDTTVLRKELDNVTQMQIDRFKKNLGNARKVVVHLGAVDESKRLEWLISAGLSIATRHPDVKIVLAGGGALLPAYSEMARMYEWLHCIGPVSGAQKAVCLASADVLAIPGRVGLVAVDAIVAGVPIVCSDDDSLHGPEFEYLVDGLNSEVVDGGELAFASRLESLITDDERRSALARGCLDGADQFSVEAMAERFLDGVEGALR